MKQKVCVVTGSRAEYGLLQRLMALVQADSGLQLQVLVTGMHLSPEFGLTYKAIEADGFKIDARVEMLLSSDTASGVAKSIGVGVIGFADALDRLDPDMVIVLGDRFEILAVCQTAMIMQLPIAHFAGGDIGAGTYDNVIRHCISKMASLHFVTHEAARRRVIQLGEHADRVFNVGATAIDNIVDMKLFSKSDLERDLRISIDEKLLLITFHPLTMDESSATDQCLQLLQALGAIQRHTNATLIFTKPNADNGGRAIAQRLETFVSAATNRYLFDSLGQRRYLSLAKLASAVVGNSSSGIYEAPYLGTPSVDIGSRQAGRQAPSSVIRCDSGCDSIVAAIETAMSIARTTPEMIYGNGSASQQALRVIKDLIGTPGLSVKTFVDMS